MIGILFKGYVWWLIIPVAGLLGYAISRLYRLETQPYNKMGMWLRGLRSAAVILLVLLLSQPVLHRVSANYQPPVVVVLRDISLSMSVKDAHEPAGHRVRTAVALNVLDPKLRNHDAEDAAARISAAQNIAETAAASIRQAAQMLQESSGESPAARDRVKEAQKTLAQLSPEIEKAGKLLSKSPQHARNAAHFAEAAAHIEKELADTPIEGAEARRRLLDRDKALQALKNQLSKLTADVRAIQDAADNALGNSGKPEVKAALANLDAMNRTAVLHAMLDEKIAPELGNRVRIVNYNFDTDLRDPAPAAKAGKDDSAGAKKKEDESAESANHPDDTDLATPLLRLAERHAQDPIAAVIMCSDGRHTTGPSPEDAARTLAARGVAVHTIGVGSLSAPRDICVARLEGTPSVFLEETIRLTAHIKSAGYKGQSCKLVLRRAEKVIQQRDVKFDDDGWIRQTFEFPADKSGANVFTASIEPLQGEALTNNNSAEFVVDVANDRLKVLLADELPRWETRYTASLLRRERKMTLDERWLQSGENRGAHPRPLPDEQKSLDEYDVVVLGDVSPERLDVAAQGRLARYVSERGGFLVIVAGPNSMPRSFPSGPLADLLPIQLHAPASSPLSSAEAANHVRLKLDPRGADNEIVRILRDPALNEQLWTALPELQWVARPAYAKPAATVLLRTDDARQDAVVAIHHYGNGRVLYIGTDNTWRWRYKVADRVHAFFWSQAMRWGTTNRLVGDPRLKAALSRRQVRPGESVEIMARAHDTDGHVVSDAVVVAELDDKTHHQRVQLQPVPGAGGLYRGVIQNIAAGVHSIRLKVDSPSFEGVGEELQVIARELTGQEGVELSRDSARLAAIANAGGGRYVDVLQAPELFSELSGQGRQTISESSYEVWSSYPALVAVVLLLAVEWLLRKRLGLA